MFKVSNVTNGSVMIRIDGAKIQLGSGMSAYTNTETDIENYKRLGLEVTEVRETNTKIVKLQKESIWDWLKRYSVNLVQRWKKLILRKQT